LFLISNQYLGLILGKYCEDYVEERGELGGGWSGGIIEGRGKSNVG
jgi:hypothetical protein